MIGQTLGHYKILDKLGAGGMGEVYRAEDTTLDREVALKILPPELAGSQERLDRFQREAKTLAALDHPNIVTVFTVEHDEDVHFLTMQLVEGKPLSELISEGGMPLERIFEIAIPLADALATAHEKGVIHRDLKPANIMVTDEGRVKVLDFGLAKLRQEAEVPLATELPTEPLTEEGKIVGTMPYMSPEQLEGKEIDARSDIFSLGVVLYEMAIGERPFKGDSSASLIAAIMTGSPREVDSLRTEIPHHLSRIVRRCLDKDPEHRYQSAKDVRYELEDLRREESFSAAVPVTPGPEPKTTKKRVRWPLVATAVAGAAIVLAALVALWLGRSQPPIEPPTEALTEPAAAVEAQPPMIVVLPFENLGVPGDEYFADGMTEEITSRLAVVSGLRVISRTSAMQYKENRPSLKQVGQELGVEYVLEGSVRWAQSNGSSRVRITPQLIRVSDDSHLWANSYERVIEDVFEIQSDIAKQVLKQLAVTLNDQEQIGLEIRPTENMEAHQAYLRGLHLQTQPEFGREQREAAVESFQRAVDLDPDFALAHAELAQAHAYMIHLGMDLSESRRNAAKEAAERALSLAPESPRVLLGVGLYYYRAYRDYETALEYLQRAAHALPNDAVPIGSIAVVQRRLGLWSEGVENLQKAFALSPRDAMLPAMLCEFLRDLRQYEQALPYCDESIALSPDSSFPFSCIASIHLLWRGDTHRAREVLEASPFQWPHGHYTMTDLVFLERNYGELIEIDEPGGETWYWNPDRAYPLQLIRAQALALVGEDDLALEAFEQARSALEDEISRSPGDHRLHSSLGVAYAGLSRKLEAIEQGLRGVELMPFSKDAYLGDDRVRGLAQIYTMVGEIESAVRQLEESLSVPSNISVLWLRLDPRFDPLRDHPRFQALLEKYGQEG